MESKREVKPFDVHPEDDMPRRQVALALLGALGGATLVGCESAAASPEPSDQVTQALVGTANVSFADSVAELRGLAGSDNSIAVLNGYWRPGDGGGGVFFWSATSAADNQGTILNVDAGSAPGWRRIYGDHLNVKWFGAKGDNIQDDTPYIRAAINEVYRLNVGFVDLPGTLQSVTSPTLFFPTGIYRVDGALGATQCMVGDRAILYQQSSTASTIQDSFSTGVFTLRGLTFRGGASGISIDNGNVSDLIVHIDECEFMTQIVAGISTGPNAGNASIHVRNCHFYQHTQVDGREDAAAMSLLSATVVTVRDCTIGAPVGDCFVLGNPGSDYGPTVHASDLSGEQSDVANTGVWFRVHSGSLKLDRCHLGTSGATKPVLANHANGNIVEITDSTLYSGDQYNFQFFGLPSFTRIKNNRGDGLGLRVDGSVPASELRKLGNSSFEYEGYDRASENGIFNGQPLVAVLGVDAYAGSQALFGSQLQRTNRPLDIADIVRVIVADFGFTANVSSGFGMAFGANAFGTTTVVGTAASNGQNATFGYATALAGIGPGTYTVVFDLRVGGSPLIVSVGAADAYRSFRFEPGRHVVCMPVNIGSQTSSLGVVVAGTGFAAGGTLAYGPMRVCAGRVVLDTENAVVQGSSPPAASTTVTWFRGDQIVNTAPAPGSSIGWVCVAEGQPGTWKTFGTIAT